MKNPSFSIIPKPKEEESSKVGIIFWCLLGILVLLVIPTMIFRGQASGLSQKKAGLVQEKEKLMADNAPLIQKMTLTFQRLNDFIQLLKGHRLNSNLFVFLGTICHPRAQFTSVVLSDAAAHISLGMRTENFKTLGEQLLILKSNPQVSNPKFASLAVDRDGKITCSLDFDYDKKIITPFNDL